MAKLYVFTGVAIKTNVDKIRVASVPGVIIRENKEEAHGAAFALTKKQFSQDDGYYNHSCLVTKVSNDIIFSLIKLQPNLQNEVRLLLDQIEKEG